MTLLDDSFVAYNPTADMNFNPNWMGGDDVVMQPELFVPHDGSWFFPWDMPNQPSNFTAMDTDNAMQ